MDAPPDRLGPYSLLSKLGSGSLGEVLLGRDDEGREVAIKVLPAELCAEAERREGFLQEARAAAELDHPGIARIVEVGEDRGRDYIAVERIEGRTLKAILGDGPLPPNRILELALSLAEALTHAHEHGVIHRDLKPENVLVTADGAPKLMDFGTARLKDEARRTGIEDSFEESTVITLSGAVYGTPTAMSPEQALGRPIDQRSEVFSFGSLLYELAAGKQAFKSGALGEVLNAVMHDEPERLAKLRPDVSPRYTGIVEKAMRKKPDERHQTMSEVIVELQACAGKMETGKTIPDPAELQQAKEAPSASKGLPVKAIVIAVVLLLVVVAVVFVLGE